MLLDLWRMAKASAFGISIETDEEDRDLLKQQLNRARRQADGEGFDKLEVSLSANPTELWIVNASLRRAPDKDNA